MNIANTTRHTLMRVGAIVAATMSALIAWVSISVVGGNDLMVHLGSEPRPVGGIDVGLVAFVSGLAAVGTAAVVGRYARRPRMTWTILSTGVFLLSLTGPLSSSAATSIVWSLIALHSVVAVVVIPQVARTLPRQRPAPSGEPATA